jgi:hypothetical protein
MAIIPSEIGGLVVWFDASTLNLSHNDPVTLWEDMSGNNRNAIAPNATTDKATFLENQINGLPSVRFSESRLDANLGASFNQPNTIFIVYSQNLAGAATIVFDGNGVYNRNYLQRNANATYGMGASTVFNVNATSVVGEFFIATLIYNTANSSFRKNGITSNAGFNIGANPMSIFRLGANLAGTKNARGDYAEVLFYNRLLTDGEIIGVESYLKSKYGFASYLELKQNISKIGQTALSLKQRTYQNGNTVLALEQRTHKVNNQILLLKQSVSKIDNQLLSLRQDIFRYSFSFLPLVQTVESENLILLSLTQKISKENIIPLGINQKIFLLSDIKLSLGSTIYFFNAIDLDILQVVYKNDNQLLALELKINPKTDFILSLKQKIYLNNNHLMMLEQQLYSEKNYFLNLTQNFIIPFQKIGSLTIRKNGKILYQAKSDHDYTPTYETEKDKPNTLYVHNKEFERGLVND